MDKDELIAAAREAAARLGTQHLSRAEFQSATGIGLKRVTRRFGSWRAFCAASGLQPGHSFSDDTIFRALHDAIVACGVISAPEVEPRLPFSRDVLYRRSGSWPGALADFASWAEKNAPDFPYKRELAHRVARRRVRATRAAKDRAQSASPRWFSTGARPAGEPLHGRPLLHEPVNEFGVVLAFGMMAKELGYVVDSVAGAFPDCIAKRRVGEKRWEAVRIEFEFRSRNFVGHGHDPKGCDVIVCWEHDWPDCPIEVLELKPAMVGR